jgi:hypothetical protein
MSLACTALPAQHRTTPVAQKPWTAVDICDGLPRGNTILRARRELIQMQAVHQISYRMILKHLQHFCSCTRIGPHTLSIASAHLCIVLKPFRSTAAHPKGTLKRAQKQLGVEIYGMLCRTSTFDDLQLCWSSARSSLLFRACVGWLLLRYSIRANCNWFSNSYTAQLTWE